jgi:predicted metal-dependent hydrolase
VSARLDQLPLLDPARDSPAFAVRVSARARRLTVRVYPGGRVQVTVPRGTRPDAVARFVSRHRAWIDARVREFASRARAANELPLEVGLPALGETWAVRYRERARAGWRIVGEESLEVAAPPADAQAARLQLRAWLTAAARAALEPWLRELAAERGFGVGNVQLRRQQTRWGSCSRSGTISLNVCLMFQRSAVVRYLMLHELCHTRQMNHSERFWRLVAEHEPDYRALDRELTRGWQQVPGWVYGG